MCDLFVLLLCVCARLYDLCVCSRLYLCLYVCVCVYLGFRQASLRFILQHLRDVCDSRGFETLCSRNPELMEEIYDRAKQRNESYYGVFTLPFFDCALFCAAVRAWCV